MSRIDHFIRQSADEGLQLNVWRTPSGYQANVKERSAAGWTVVTTDDPVDAVVQALAHRATRWPDREVVVDPVQMDIEDAIAARRESWVEQTGELPENMPADDDDFGDLL